MLNGKQLKRLRRQPASAPRLHAAMGMLGLTQLDLEAETTVPQATISRLANGVHVPSLVTAHKLAEYFGCQIDDLFPRESVAS